MTQIHEYLLDFFMTLLALSSLVLWGILFSGGSFSAYAVLVLAAPLVAGYLVMVNSRGDIPAAPVETAAEHYGNRFRIESVAILALLLFIFFSQSSLVMIVLLLVIVFLLLRQTTVRPAAFHLIFDLGKTTIHIGCRSGHRRFLHFGLTSTYSR